MTYGLISDIHGNLEALDAVLAELRGVSAFLCLGDIVGYGADPGACIERIRKLPHLICVAGNHDLAAIGNYDLDWFNPYARAAVEWTAEQLSPSHRAYLASLPLTAHADSAIMVHGALPNEMDYITTPEEARRCFDAMPADLIFIGHTHIAEFYRTKRRTRLPEQIPLWSGGRVGLANGFRYIINTGAIGQPRDGNSEASFGLWEVASKTVEVKRVKYDIASTQAKMRKAGLPDYLADRLSVGR